MHKSLKSLALAAATALVVAAVAAPATAATVYTDPSAFQAVLGTHAFDNFNDLAYGSVQSATYSRGVVNGYQVTYSSPTNTLYSNPASMSVNTASTALLLTFDSGNVTAIGGDFFAGDFSGNLMTANLTLTLSDSTVVNFTGGSTFYGFTSTTPIASLSISTGGTYLGNNAWPSVDNLYIGQALNSNTPGDDVQAVPTPAAAAAALPLLGLLAAKRRRQS